MEINDITLELFDDISHVAAISDEQKEKIFTFLTALLEVKYVGDDEKDNLLVLLQYLQDREDCSDFSQLIKTLIAKFSFKVKKPWDFDLPDNFSFMTEDGEVLTIDDLRKRGIDHLDCAYTKPIRNTPLNRSVWRLHSDGTHEDIHTYTVYEQPPVAEDYLFSEYGEKSVQMMKRHQNDNCE